MSETVTAPEPARTQEHPVSSPLDKLPFSRREQVFLIVLILIASTLFLYRPALHGYFQTYDDPEYVVQNPNVNTGLSWANVRWSITAVTADNWHPLTWISHMADVQLFGLKPMGHHLDSILWHVLNVVLLFLLLRAATGYVWRSATVAALFALCPLNVECVAWIAERKSLICTTFLFLTLFAYGWYVKRRTVGRYLLVLALFALGLTAKPMVVTLPVLLLLVDYWPLGRFSLSGHEDPGLVKRLSFLCLEKLPLFAVSLASSLITVYAQKNGGALVWMALIPLRYRIENAIVSYGLYVEKMFWPSRLSPFYRHPGASLNLSMVVAVGLALIAVTVAAWRYRRMRELIVGWGWYLVSLIPVIGIIQMGDQAWADRYAYIPYIGLFVAVVWLVADLTPRVKLSHWALGLAAVVVLSGYAWASRVQVHYWNDSYTLFSHALELDPKNGIAESALGLASLGAGDLQAAEREYRAATKLMPTYGALAYDLGVTLEAEDKFEEALVVLRRSTLLGAPNYAYEHIARILLRNPDVPSAVAEYDAAIGIGPDSPESLGWRGVIEYRRGDIDAAAGDLAKSARLLPNANTCFLLGRVLEDKRDLAGAANAYTRVLQMAPRYPEVASRLAAIRKDRSR